MRHPKNTRSFKNSNSLGRKSTDRVPQNMHSKRQENPAIRVAEGNRVVMGRNASREMLQRNQERVVRCFSAMASGGDKVGKDLLSAAHARGVTVIELDRDRMDELCGGGVHQGICLEVREREFWDLPALLHAVSQKERSVVLALDNIQDPQNLGSILRAAECFGVDAVMWSKNRGSDLTAAAAKVSVGASEIVPIAKVSNLRDALMKLKSEGFWVVAAVIAEDAQRISSFVFPEKTVLVMGSEGDGIQPLIAKEADFRVYIQQHGVIDSLNVSQATAVFLSEFCRQRMDVDKNS